MLRSLIVVLALALPAAAAAQPEAEEPAYRTPCEAVIDCDCDSIEAGLLTGPWRNDCSGCQQALIDACLEVYSPSQPLWPALTRGGYCETRCSVTGPNPYPPAPPAGGGDTGVPTTGTMELLCPFFAHPVVEERDGLTWYGCRDEAGTPVGPWTAVDAAGAIVEERFHGADGAVLHGAR